MKTETNMKATKQEEKQASKYTHSVWSGKKYDRPQTHAELVAESMKVLRRHPTIKLIGGKQ